MSNVPSIYYNHEAEETVIGALLLEPELFGSMTVKPDQFYDARFTKMFKWMTALHEAGEPIDIVTIGNIAKERISEVGGLTFLMDIATAVPSARNIHHYEAIVIDNWKRREKYLVYTEAIKSIDEENIDAKTQNRIEEIENEGRRLKKFSLKDKLIEIYDDAENTKKGLVGSSTGFRDLDTQLDGLEKKKFIVVAARPSVGKTAFAINVSKNAIKQSLNNLLAEEVYSTIFSLEMGDKQLLKRMISEIGNIDGQAVKNPREFFSSEDWRKYTHALSELASYEENLDICEEATITVEQIRRRVKENIKEYPKKHHIVVIDYLQLIQGTGEFRGNRQQEISEISRSLKKMAMELNITVIALSQLSRGVEQRQDKRPMLSDLRESGAIEQDADIIAFLYRDDYYDKESESKNMIEIIIAKNREGSTGTVMLAYIKEFSKFVNIDWKGGAA